MKIFKLRDIKKRYYREAIRAFIDTADIKDIDSLCRAVEFNKSLTMEEYGAIYYAVAHMRQRYLTAEPRVVVATMDAINAGAVDKFEDTLKSKQYGELELAPFYRPKTWIIIIKKYMYKVLTHLRH